MAIQYDRKQITAWLDAYTVAKARDYGQAVSDLQWQGDDILAGKVQGTRSRPYNVRVWFNDPDDDLWIESECSCPVGGHCKHVAALLLAGLTHVPRQAITG
ncbi:MAG TPA: SWIM zinc finger family protein, partial [Burkholderiales bacterium]|nr:SWIM zinc finger family protein [Burkholderiales bacterium]